MTIFRRCEFIMTSTVKKKMKMLLMMMMVTTTVTLAQDLDDVTEQYESLRARNRGEKKKPSALE